MPMNQPKAVAEEVYDLMRGLWRLHDLDDRDSRQQLDTRIYRADKDRLKSLVFCVRSLAPRCLLPFRHLPIW